MTRLAFLFAVGLAVLSGPAAAQTQPEPSAAPSAATDKAAPEQPPGAAPGRYSFNRVEGGFVRLDTVTGQASLCSERAVGWACQAMPEERNALENEIMRLSEDNAALKKQLAARATSPDTNNSDQHLKLPTDQDLDRAIAFIEKAWRRFVALVNRLQKDVMPKT